MHRRQFLQAAASGLLLMRGNRVGAASGRTLRVGPQHALKTVAAAASEARDGDTVEIEGGEYPGDVAVWTQRDLSIRGVNGRPQLIAAGASAEDKGIWVLRGGDIRIENLELRGARVPHFNGAGIRLEQGRLHAINVRFIDNEMGVLTANRPEIELRIEACEFSGPIEVRERIPHNLYAGKIARLEVSASYFHHGHVGHLLKSRAKENIVLYNRLTDEDGQASYEMEFPSGGKVLAVGNIIQQSARTQNPTLVSFGAEGYGWPENRLVLAHNTLLNAVPNGIWVKAFSGNAHARLWRNLYVGTGNLSIGVEAEGLENIHLESDQLVAPEHGDFRLKRSSSAAHSLNSPSGASEEIPRQESLHPLRVAALPALSRWNPGALQTLG